MTSAIDPTKPETGTATTASVRQNFDHAKTEIESLQEAIAQEIIDRNAAIAAAIASIPDTQLPVGSIYLSTVSTNPAILLGYGTWAAIAAGRVLVGLDTSQTEFDTIGKTGGSKTHTLTTAEMPSHNHTQNAHNHAQNEHNHTQNPHYHTQTTAGISGYAGTYFARGDGYTSALNTANATATNQATTATNQATTATNKPTGGDGAHNNLQPYFVVNIWQRTA